MSQIHHYKYVRLVLLYPLRFSTKVFNIWESPQFLLSYSILRSGVLDLGTQVLRQVGRRTWLASSVSGNLTKGWNSRQVCRWVWLLVALRVILSKAHTTASHPPLLVSRGALSVRAGAFQEPKCVFFPLLERSEHDRCNRTRCVSHFNI